MQYAMIATRVFCALITFTLGACDKAGDAESVAAASSSARAPSADLAHAPAGVEPGSYQDWCGEHQVPESLCSRCNPSLIAAFKATRDWCEEHTLPESQCKICNPDLKIERPPQRAKARQ